MPIQRAKYVLALSALLAGESLGRVPIRWQTSPQLAARRRSKAAVLKHGEASRSAPDLPLNRLEMESVMNPLPRTLVAVSGDPDRAEFLDALMLDVNDRGVI